MRVQYPHGGEYYLLTYKGYYIGTHVVLSKGFEFLKKFVGLEKFSTGNELVSLQKIKIVRPNKDLEAKIKEGLEAEERRMTTTDIYSMAHSYLIEKHKLPAGFVKCKHKKGINACKKCEGFGLRPESQDLLDRLLTKHLRIRRSEKEKDSHETTGRESIAEEPDSAKPTYGLFANFRHHYPGLVTEELEKSGFWVPDNDNIMFLYQTIKDPEIDKKFQEVGQVFKVRVQEYMAAEALRDEELNERARHNLDRYSRFLEVYFKLDEDDPPTPVKV